jgi:hypothetical protein
MTADAVPTRRAFAEKILKQTVSPHIRLLILAAPGLRPAWVDPNQLELAILNLALNALGAMPSGGTLQIACEKRRSEVGNAPPNLAPAGRRSLHQTGTARSGRRMSPAQRSRDAAARRPFAARRRGRRRGTGQSSAYLNPRRANGSAIAWCGRFAYGFDGRDRMAISLPVVHSKTSMHGHEFLGQ